MKRNHHLRRAPPDREILRKLIIDQNNTVEMTKILKCSRNVLARWLYDYILPTRGIKIGSNVYNGFNDAGTDK